MSFQQDSAADIASVEVATSLLTYATTASCCFWTSATIFGSSCTVLVFTVVASLEATFQPPGAGSA